MPYSLLNAPLKLGSLPNITPCKSYALSCHEESAALMYRHTYICTPVHPAADSFVATPTHYTMGTVQVVLPICPGLWPLWVVLQSPLECLPGSIRAVLPDHGLIGTLSGSGTGQKGTVEVTQLHCVQSKRITKKGHCRLAMLTGMQVCESNTCNRHNSTRAMWHHILDLCTCTLTLSMRCLRSSWIFEL